VPEGFDGTKVVQLAAEKYHVAFGVGLGEVAGKVFRIGHLGMLTDVMVLSGSPRPRCAWPISAGR
jgi:alanine-glyoxylate transaminase / serine-glyoxylate transaminase / serine-pyruvate transaminase